MVTSLEEAGEGGIQTTGVEGIEVDEVAGAIGEATEVEGVGEEGAGGEGN